MPAKPKTSKPITPATFDRFAKKCNSDLAKLALSKAKKKFIALTEKFSNDEELEALLIQFIGEKVSGPVHVAGYQEFKPKQPPKE